MKKGKNNNCLISILISISVILLVLCILFATGTISLKNSKTNNNGQNNINDQIKSDFNNETSTVIENSKSSNGNSKNISNNINKVFISEDNEHYLILWDDGTYKYTNNNDSGTLGKYSLNNEELVLYYMFSIDSSHKNKVNVTDGSKVLKVVSQSQIIDNNMAFQNFIHFISEIKIR